MVHEPIKIILVWCFLFRFLKIPATSGEIGKWKPGYIVPRPLPEDIMVDTVNYIALSLLHAHSENNENNIAISPYGATSVLVAVTEGVKGIALEEILRATFLPFDMTVTRIGLRDMHRHLKSYFVPQEGFLAGLTFNHENITLKPSYVDTIKFYGYDVKSFNKGIYPEPNPTTSTSTQSTGGTSSKMTTTIVSTESTTGSTMESTTPVSTESTKRSSSEMTTTIVSTESTAESTAESTTSVSTESTEGSSSEMMTTMNTESTAESTMESTTSASTESTEGSSSEMMTTMNTESTVESTMESTTSASTESTKEGFSEMTTTTVSTESTTESTAESTTSVSTESTEESSSEMMTTMSTETTAESTMESTTSVSTESTEESSSEMMTTMSTETTAKSTMESTTSGSTASREGVFLNMTIVNSTKNTDKDGGRGGLGIKAQPLTTKLSRQDNTDLSVTSMRKSTTNIKPGSLTALITDKTVETTKKITTKRQVSSTSILPITRTSLTPAATYAENTLHSTKHFSTVVFTDDIITKNNAFTASPLTLIYSTPTEKEAHSTVIKKSSTEASTTTQKLKLTPLQTTLKTFSIISSTSPFITKKQTLSVTATETPTSLSTESSSTKVTTARLNLKKLSSTDTTVPFSTLPSTVFIQNDISETTFPTTQSNYPKLSLTTHSGYGEVRPVLAETTFYDYHTRTDTFPLNKPSTEIKTNLLATDTTKPNMVLQNNEAVNKNQHNHERKLERQQRSILTSSYRGSKAQGVKLSLVAKVTNTFDTKTLNKYVTSNKQVKINKDSFIDQQKIERFEEHGLNNSLISFLIKRQTANNVEQIRRRQIRSIVDFLIAKYYDTHPTYSSVTYGLGYEPPPPTSFLVNTKIREPNVQFLTYDTVLPFRYISRLNSLALTFPLDNTKFYLLLVLPTNEMGLENLITNILSTTLKQIVYSLQPTRVKAIIPNFTLKGAVTLTPTLQKLGIRQIFEPGRADFSRMTDDKDVYVTNIEQAVTITISDFINPGTSINDNHKFRRRGPVQFTADHPFLYFVMESEIHVSLMVGKIVNPSNSRIR